MKPLALLKPATAAERARGSFKMRELDAAMAQLVVHLNFSQRDSAQPRITQIAHQHLRQLPQDCLGEAGSSAQLCLSLGPNVFA